MHFRCGSFSLRALLVRFLEIVTIAINHASPSNLQFLPQTLILKYNSSAFVIWVDTRRNRGNGWSRSRRLVDGIMTCGTELHRRGEVCELTLEDAVRAIIWTIHCRQSIINGTLVHRELRPPCSSSDSDLWYSQSDSASLRVLVKQSSASTHLTPMASILWHLTMSWLGQLWLLFSKVSFFLFMFTVISFFCSCRESICHGDKNMSSTTTWQGKKMLSQWNVRLYSGTNHRLYMGIDRRSNRQTSIQYHTCTVSGIKVSVNWVQTASLLFPC